MTQTKTTTAAADPKLFHQLQELVRDIDIAMITTVTPEGALRSRPMATRAFDDDGQLWFFIADDSAKAEDLAAEHAVNVSYADPKQQRYLSITGNAVIVRDREKARELWDPRVKTYFPGGLDDPHLALLCVRIETAEAWDSPAGTAKRLIDSARRHRNGGHAGEDGHVKMEIRATPTSG